MNSPFHARYLNGLNIEGGRFYVLLQNNQTIVVQAPPVVKPNYDYSVDPIALAQADKDQAYGLEIIQSLLTTIRFGYTNWAYLVQPRRGGSYQIHHRERPIYSVTCQPWAPIVYEDELEITSWLSCEERHGRWGKRDVDLFFGWNDLYAEILDREMHGHRQIEGLDLTYKVLGHIADKDGKIIGIMKEPAFGRLVEKHDRRAVYQAISTLQRRHLIFQGISLSNIMMTSEGKVRLLSIDQIVTSPMDADTCDKETDFWHWKQLSNVFSELQHGCNTMPVMRSMNPRVILLPHPPSPGRPIASRPSVILLWMIEWQSYCNTQHRRNNRSRRGTLLATEFYISNLVFEDSCESEFDSKASTSDHFRFRSNIRNRLLQYHPYLRSPRTNRLLLGYDDSDRSSECDPN